MAFEVSSTICHSGPYYKKSEFNVQGFVNLSRADRLGRLNLRLPIYISIMSAVA